MDTGQQMYLSVRPVLLFNPSSLISDENEISLYIITTCLNTEVMRIKEVITKDYRLDT